MRLALVVIASLLMLALGQAAAAADPQSEPEREAWQAEISAAHVRAEIRRNELKADLERRKVERLSDPKMSADLERARRASEQVRNDDSLQRGDIVSTIDGLFVYVGSGDGERTPDDFVPLTSPSR